MKESATAMSLVQTYLDVSNQIDKNQLYFISTIGSKIRGLDLGTSDTDLAGVFIESAKNRRSFIKTNRTYRFPEHNLELIEIKQFFNHLIFAKPTAYEMLNSPEMFVSGIRDIETLRFNVYGYRDVDALYYQYSKMAYGCIKGGRFDDKQLIRGIYFYLLAEASKEKTDGWCDLDIKSLMQITDSLIPVELKTNIETVIKLYRASEHIDLKLRNEIVPKIIKSRTKIMDAYVEKPNKDLHEWLTQYMKHNFY